VPLETCEKRAARVSFTALVRYRGNDYLTPTAYGFSGRHREAIMLARVERRPARLDLT
jgi:hypothetical protein